MEISWRYLIGFERWRRFEMHAALSVSALLITSACIDSSTYRGVTSKPVVPSNTASPDAAKIVDAYNTYRNQVCTALIDVCGDQEYINSTVEELANIRCGKLRIEKSKCTFTIMPSSSRRDECVAYFDFIAGDDESYWSLDYDTLGKPKIRRPNVKCRTIRVNTQSGGKLHV